MTLLFVEINQQHVLLVVYRFSIEHTMVQTRCLGAFSWQEKFTITFYNTKYKS